MFMFSENFKVKRYVNVAEAKCFLRSAEGLDTKHFNDAKTNRRKERSTNYDVNAKPVDGFIALIDKGHKNGQELHVLFDDFTIRIFNYNSKKQITFLNARVAQAERLMDMFNRNASKNYPLVVAGCLENERKGLNNV